uniref:thiamine pyrophosphate-dependent enzyme n=1 Tax=Intestinibacillus massiliensis TaxID=1871029 RepID=UPI000B34ED86|nr:thiamine pyrophosphate-dependent enzyme [Intestinibacillus massiliensis]
MREQKVKMTNAEVVAACLKRHGVEYIFGQSNPSKITLACIDAGIRQIGYRQENAGSYMAQAYGMSTRKVPVVTAQNGPAATLLVPGLAECLKASHPVVAIVQQIALNDYEKNAFQEMDHEKLFSGCAKWIKTVQAQDRIEDYIDMAFAEAAGGRPGPAVLLFPVDLFNDDTQYEHTLYRTESLGHCPLDRTVADPSRIAEAAKLLMAAERPVIYAGGGVISSRAQAEIRAIQDKYSFPVATTMMGKGAVDETHPLSIGVSGYISGKRGMAKFLKPMVSEADVVLLVGNRTNQNGELAKLDGAKRAAARPALEAQIAKGREEHLKEIQDVTTNANSAPVKPEKFVAELEKHLDPDHILVADASFSSIWIANYLQSKDQREFYLPRGLAGLGWGFPMAMGLKIANPHRKVFCISGDGGFAHVWSELETCKREGIDVVCVVLNNEMLGYQYYAEHAKFGAHTNACIIHPVDYVKVAEACGLTGFRLDDPAKIDEVLDKAFAAEGTVIIDLVTDDRSVPPVSLLQTAAPQI